MKHSIVFSVVLTALALSACERPTVVTPPPTIAVPVPVPVPGPPGPQGAPGEPGKPGKPGDTIVIVPPAEPQQR